MPNNPKTMTKMKNTPGTHEYTKVGGPEEKGGGPVQIETWKPNRQLQATGESRKPYGTNSVGTSQKQQTTPKGGKK